MMPNSAVGTTTISARMIQCRAVWIKLVQRKTSAARTNIKAPITNPIGTWVRVG